MPRRTSRTAVRRLVRGEPVCQVSERRRLPGARAQRPEVSSLVAHFPAGVSRRLGPTGTRMLQIATHWAAYVRYLESVEHDLGSVSLPGLGETRLAELFVPVRLRPWPDGGSDDDGAASPGTLVSP